MMKALSGLAILLFTFNAFAADRQEHPCNQKSKLAKVERAVVADIRARFAEGNAYSFKFSPILNFQKTSDLAVFFEEVNGKVGEDRRGYTAQYSVHPKTCAVQFLKMQPMYTQQEFTSGAAAVEQSERCNQQDQVVAMQKAVIDYISYLDKSILPNATIGNFTFSGVERTKNASDMTVFWEANQPGISTTSYIAKVSVDPNTCKPQVQVATAFTWLLITY